MKANKEILCCVVLLLAGCGNSSNATKAQANVPQEAIDAAQSQLVDYGFKKCNDDTWGAFLPQDALRPDEDFEAKNLHFTISGRPKALTEADKMNGGGTTWEGLVSLDATVSRMRPHGGTWGKWEDGFGSTPFNTNFAISQVSGKWIVYSPGLLEAKPGCTE